MTPTNQTDFTASNASYVSAQSKMALLPNYYKWTYSALKPYLRGKVVELAAGAGYGIGTYIDQTSKVIAVDHDPDLLRVLKSQYTDVETLDVDLLGDWEELDGGADAIVMMDVVEHFEDDLAFLRKVHSKLKPGGHALIKVPAQEALYSQIDVASGHYRRYEEKMLRALAVSSGFEVCLLRHINVIGSMVYKRKKNNKSNFSKTFKSSQLKLINLLIPLIAAVDSILPGPGLSLVAVLQRPE
ncbi:class I SAM-dependent methyltransferase [Rhizobium lentis]|uniref:class I SAM-dependent methyltransferase n=1 Tax=Rhizobium lentis TaxID=1138194 RepID=UPI001C8336AF|nr:class I SAM-dependent methyltransferase [Rhizobium lentis]MBX5153715.1 class I SAM-dependent methyltransferase [Rhizobium lentis]